MYTEEQVDDMRAADAAYIAELEYQLDEQTAMFLKCERVHEDMVRWSSCNTREQKDEEIKRRVLRGDPTNSINADIKVRYDAVKKIRNQLGLPTSKEQKQATQGKKEEIRRLLREGKPTKYITKALDVSTSSVSRIRAELHQAAQASNAAA
jgi:FixJ family two-component response regulator